MPGPSTQGITVRLPRALLQYWTGPASVKVVGSTLDEALSSVERQAPGLASRILDDQGRIRRHVAVFVNGAMLVSKEPASVLLKDGDEVHIVPSVSGG